MNCHNFQRHNKRSFKSVDGYMCWNARWVDLEIEMFYRTIRRPSFFAPRFAQDMQWPGFTLVWGEQNLRSEVKRVITIEIHIG